MFLLYTIFYRFATKILKKEVGILIILGIDPGLATMGYGVVKAERGKIEPIDYGVVLTPKEESLPKRLELLQQGLTEVIEKYKPDEAALEELFFCKNITTGINVAHARGVILLTLVKHCGKLFEYTPMQIKQGLTGYGRADKRQIQQMVKLVLGLKEVPKPDDAADALAVAVLHAQTGRLSAPFGIRGRT